MTGEITPFRKGMPTASERKQQFLDAVATSFDEYVQREGHEPEFLAYVLSGYKMKAQTSWTAFGMSEFCAGPMIAHAGACLTHDAIK